VNRLINALVTLGVLLPLAAAALTGDEILARIDMTFTTDSMWSVAQETIVTPEGESRSFTIESYAKDGSRLQLTKYVKPASVAGTTFLMLDYGDDIWTYFPDTGRTRQIAANARHRSVMGSNMTYEDMAIAGNYQDNYDAEALGREDYAGVECHKLKLTPSYAYSSYSRLIAWVDPGTWVPLRIDYYDETGELLKRMLMRDIRSVSGIPTPYYTEVRGLQDNSLTKMTLVNVRYDLDLSEDLFSTSQLGD
jgi:outer membrane lipoprotein-sorting protein